MTPATVTMEALLASFFQPLHAHATRAQPEKPTPMMTRKDYQLIAATLRYILCTSQMINLDRAQFDFIVDRFAKNLAGDNTSFDERKFRRAIETI